MPLGFSQGSSKTSSLKEGCSTQSWKADIEFNMTPMPNMYILADVNFVSKNQILGLLGNRFTVCLSGVLLITYPCSSNVYSLGLQWLKCNSHYSDFNDF